ncbi:MAG TPA: transposase [Lacunisphaera sp.]|nr:transposase [Lacunisphaera sp.]
MASGRRTGQLHGHRLSVPQTTYFVTCCTFGRRTGLSREPVAPQLRSQVIDCDAAQDTATLGFTIMPDHLHWVFRLEHRLSLGRIVARLKARTNAGLAAAGLEWQRDFFEHRLEPREDLEAYALYVYLNPYRARLVSADGTWPWWWTAAPGLLRFPVHLNSNGSPPAKWIGEPVPAWVCHGE